MIMNILEFIKRALVALCKHQALCFLKIRQYLVQVNNIWNVEMEIVYLQMKLLIPKCNVWYQNWCGSRSTSTHGVLFKYWYEPVELSINDLWWILLFRMLTGNIGQQLHLEKFRIKFCFWKTLENFKIPFKISTQSSAAKKFI